MTLQVQGGWLDGSNIRKARKTDWCFYWHGKDKYCPECAGPDVLATIAMVGC
jgi:hypothetical protein